MTLEPEVLAFIIEKIKAAYHPSEIYLYGSRAWGQPTNQSDIDLFVVLESSTLEMDDRIRLGARALSGSGLDVDLLVMTKAEVLVRKEHPSTLTHKVLTKGIKVYDAA